MKLCYIYFNQIRYPSPKALLKQFEYEMLDIAASEIKGEYDVYILDIEHYTKEITLQLHKGLKNKNNSLIYMISYGKTNANFYQLAYLLDVKSIITPKQETQTLISMIKNAYLAKIYENKSLYVGKFLSETLCYMSFKEKKLHYASETLLKTFEINSLEEVEEKICSKLPLDTLLSHTDTAVVIKNFFHDDCVDIVRSIYKNKEYLLTLESFSQSQLNLSSATDVATRLKFIDILKDRIGESNTKDHYSVISIKITNFKKIGNLVGKSQIEEFVFEFIEETKKMLAPYLVISEYNQDFFVVLYKNVDFDTLIEKAQHFYDQIEAFIQKFQFKVDIALHVLELDNIELGIGLSILDSIRNNTLSKKELKHRRIKYIGRYSDDMSDKEIIHLLFENSYINDMEIRLINIYKGMVIDFFTKIIKKEASAIYVAVDKTQATVMSIEKSTILQSSLYERDIKAKVAFVDLKRKIAKLENFKIVEDNSAYLETDRVAFAKKTMAILSFVGTKISAEIIDISPRTINLKVNNIKMLHNLINKKITISFSVPTNRTREKMIQIEEEVTILHLNKLEKEEKSSMKLVCEFDEASKSRNIIKEFVKNRQAEILQELDNIHF